MAGPRSRESPCTCSNKCKGGGATAVEQIHVSLLGFGDVLVDHGPSNMPGRAVVGRHDLLFDQNFLQIRHQLAQARVG